jgi:hypothetical protein
VRPDAVEAVSRWADEVVGVHAVAA